MDDEEYHRNHRHQTKEIPDGPTRKAKRPKMPKAVLQPQAYIPQGEPVQEEQEVFEVDEDPMEGLDDGQGAADVEAELNPLEEHDPMMGNPEAEDILGVSESTQDCTSDVVEFNSEGKFCTMYEGKHLMPFLKFFFQ